MYEFAVVSLIDVLGFSDLVKSSSYKKVSQTLTRFQEFSGAKETPKYDYSPEVYSFSDLIIRIRKWKPSAKTMHPIGLLILEIGDLQRTQALLIDQNIFIRGAVTQGQISTSHNLVFGPAFLDAYTLESKFATYPRIVVSERALQDLQDTDKPLNECTDRSYDKELVQQMLRQGEDGSWFINYLYGIESDLETSEAYIKFLIRHRDAIRLRSKKLTKAKKLTKTRELLKYQWLVCYHNRRVDELEPEWLAEYDLDPDALKISPKDTQFLYAF